MRPARVCMLILFLFLASSLWAQQLSTSNTQPPNDPEAVAVVQAAITALGGAVAINQVQNWTFQAQMQGLHGNDNVNYALSATVSPQATINGVDGTAKAKKMRASRSFFIPFVLGYVLLNQFQSQEFPLKFSGQTDLGSGAVAVVTFSNPQNPALMAQRWYFDTITNLPVRIEFLWPAAVGPKISFSGVIEVSGYKATAGVLYPSKVVTISDTSQTDIIILQLITPSASSLPADTISAGDESQ